MNVFKAPVKIRHTGTPAATTSFWSMRLKDASSRLIEITRAYLVMTFDGTAATSDASYTLVRYDSATATGGATIDAVGYGSKQTATHMTDIRDDFDGSGLTLTGIDNHRELVNIGLPRTPTGQVQVYDIKDICTLEYLDGSSQGFGIYVDNTGVIGDGLYGFIEWKETER